MSTVIEHRRALVRGFIDGTLKPEELATFEVQVRDPEVARHLLRELHFDQAIRVTARSQDRRLEIESSPTLPPASVRLRRRRARWSALVRPRWLPAAALVLVCVAVGFGLLHELQTRTPLAELVVHLGTVTIDGEERRGASTVRRDQPFMVSPRGWASLRFPDGTLVSLDGGSAVLVARDRAGLHLTLNHGTLSADVRRQPAGQALRIHSPRAAATVVGTRLEFASLPTGDRLAVREGLVRLTRVDSTQAIDVPGGNQVAVASDGPLKLERIRPPGPPLPEPPSGGLVLWLDPAHGIERDTNGRVAAWNDRLGKGLRVENAQSAQRPRVANEERPAVRFAPQAEMLHGRIPWPTTGAFTVALAMKSAELGSWSQTLGWGWGSFAFHAQADGGVYAGVGAPGGGIRFHPGNGPEDLPTRTAVIGRWQRFIITYGHGVGAFYADGRLIARKAMPPPRADDSFSIGRGDVPANEPFGFAGDLGEVLVYDRLLEPHEITTLDLRLQRMPTP